jgi:hypothetical protein
MAQVQQPTTRRVPMDGQGAWTGWALFAAIMLGVNGAINVIQGLVAMLQDDYFLVRDGDELLVTDFTVWGVVILLWGCLLLLAAFSLYRGSGWARWFAILVVALSVLVQIAFLAAFPLWSLVIIGFDVTVIYALCAHWDEARI